MSPENQCEGLDLEATTEYQNFLFEANTVVGQTG
jgi:hypothetical protein